jgi:1-acyl-sn-glycerol-3-phosphate acyltransferase
MLKKISFRYKIISNKSIRGEEDMIIVFVIDNYGALTNGTTITAYRFREELIKRGHTVRVVGVGISGADMYPVRERRIPLVTRVSRKQNTYYGKPEIEVLKRAFAGADMIHFFYPWKLSRVGKRLADRMGIPSIAAFHCQPENVTYGMGLGRAGRPLAYILYRKFKKFYRKFDNIHCPSLFIADQLKKHGYRNKMHVISNGVSPEFKKREVARSDDRINILMIGRYAPEKRQDLLIKAVKASKHESRIRLYFAGAGPREKKLRRLAEGLANPPVFGFYSEKELIEVINRMDLYVHASDVEIEAIACMEAIACGLVPVISDSKKSATRQFAVDERSLFKAGDYLDLRDKIDYWLDNPEEKEKITAAYREKIRYYSIDYSIKKAEEMYRESTRDSRDRAHFKEMKEYTRQINRGLIFRGLSFAFYFLIAFPLLWAFQKVAFGFRVKNRKYLRRARKKGGAVTISNHVHILDSAMTGVASFPKKPIFTSIPDNFQLKYAGYFVSLLGAVPIPQTQTENRLFFHKLSGELRKGRFVHFYPEGELIKNDDKLRGFKRGAFKLAVEAQVPILPMVIRFKRGRWLIIRRKYIELVIGEPIYPNRVLLKREAVNTLYEKTVASMQKLMTG